MRKEVTTIEEFVDVMLDFKSALLFVRRNHREWMDKFTKCNCQINDILHAIEFESHSKEQKVEMYDMLETIQSKRRKYKNLKDLTDTFWSMIDFKPLIDEIDKINLNYKYIKRGKKYNPREFKDMFSPHNVMNKGELQWM